MTLAVVLALLTLGRVTADLRDGWMFSRDGGVWRPVEVPHDWAIEGPFDPEGDPSTGKLPWKGKGRYRRTLVLDRAPAGERLWLDCEGVMMRSRVYVNGRACGRGEYGYLGFRTDLTPYLAAGTNTIEIAADTTHFHSRWYPGGGLYRPVRLVRASDVYLDERNLSVTTPRVSSAEAAVRVTGKVTSRRTKPAGASVTVRLVDPSGAEAGRAERTVFLVPCGEADFAADFTVAAPKLWKLERNAALYTVEVSVRGEGAEDAVAVRTGLRSFRFDPKRGFFLNGERVQLKGVDLHGDLGVLGTAYDRSAMRRQLEVMRDMGANALRTSHNPAAPETMDLCDEMGIFVWNECFDKWEDTSGRDEEPEEAFVERQLRRFVRRDRNHPCVFVWSVGNEIPFSEPLPAGSDWKGHWVNVYGTTPERCWRFANLVRALDPTRPVALGCCRPEGVARGDYAAFDLTGWNYNGQYGTMARAYPEKPVLYSESASAFSEAGCYPEHVATNKTDYPVSLRATDSYDRTAASWSDIPDREFERMERDTYVGGEFVWTGIDYIGEPSPYADPKAHGGIPVRELSRSSHFGICDLTVRPKDRYWLYRSHWNREAFTLHLVPEHWNFAGRKTLPVYVYTSADEAELFVNGVSQGRRKKDPAASSDAGYYGILPRYRLMWDAVPYAPGEVKAVAYGKDGRVLGERALKTADAPAKVVLEPEKPVLKADELLFVNVSLADEKGVFVPDRRDRITFRVEGPARIVSVGNGDPRGLDSFKDVSSHPLFAGRAVVVLRRTGAGPVTLSAVASGCGGTTPGALTLRE